MKKIYALIFSMILCLSLCACGRNTAQSVDDFIADAPSITGIVTEVHDKYIVIQGEPNELYHLSEKYHVSLPAEYENPDTSYSVGDEVIVYYDGNIAESDPLQINTVYAITLKTPAAETITGDFNSTKWLDGVTFIDLAPGEEVKSSTEVIVKNDNAIFQYSITYGRAALTLEYGLQAVDGTEYSREIIGGSEIGTIENIPAGTYYLFVRNSGDYSDLPAYQDKSISYNATGAMNYAITLKTPAAENATVPTKIPGLTISYGDEEITAWVGGHSWVYEDEKGEKNAIIKESNHPLHCMETMSFIPVWATTVSHAVGYEPGQVTLNFGVEPTKITVYRYDVEAADETAGEEIIMDNGYVLDLAFGNYLYHIAAEWDCPDKELGGSGDYAFYTKAPEIYNPKAE